MRDRPEGVTVRRLDGRYAVSVYPMVDGPSGERRPEDRPAIARLLAALHGATPAVAAATSRLDLALPGRDRLRAALDGLDLEWAGGPYSEPARRLLTDRADHVERLLDEFDALVVRMRASAGDWVVTHGEPHPGNVIRGPSGLHLVDWDTVRIAPAERDLWMVAGDSGEVLAEYTRTTGREVDPAGIALYRSWWDLADIASYVDELRRPHRATGDTAAAWEYLRGYLA